jgi:hypothetical protein
LITQTRAHLGFTDSTLSGEEFGSTQVAPVVATLIDQNEAADLRRLVREKEGPGEEMDDGSELSSVPASEDGGENDSGRPNFKRASLGLRKEESTPEFFGRGKNRMRSNSDDISDTPRRDGHGEGALGRTLVAAGGKSQKGERRRP